MIILIRPGFDLCGDGLQSPVSGRSWTMPSPKPSCARGSGVPPLRLLLTRRMSRAARVVCSPLRLARFGRKRMGSLPLRPMSFMMVCATLYQTVYQTVPLSFSVFVKCHQLFNCSIEKSRCLQAHVFPLHWFLAVSVGGALVLYRLIALILLGNVSCQRIRRIRHLFFQKRHPCRHRIRIMESHTMPTVPSDRTGQAVADGFWQSGFQAILRG